MAQAAAGMPTATKGSIARGSCQNMRIKEWRQAPRAMREAGWTAPPHIAKQITVNLPLQLVTRCKNWHFQTEAWAM
jgi:hypothetical protein